MLGVSPRTIRRYLAEGRIRGHRNPLNGRWFVARVVLRRLLDEAEVPGAEDLLSQIHGAWSAEHRIVRKVDEKDHG